MIEEDKSLKMSHSIFHDSLLATARDKSKTKSANVMASNRSPESQLQGDKKRQKTYEQEANEEQKNVQATAEFWAAMRQTNGFQNQTTGPQFQAEVVETPGRQSGTSSRQQTQASIKSQGKPKRRRSPDDESATPTNLILDKIIARPAKRNTELTSEYTKPITTATLYSDTPASGSGETALMTTKEADTNQTLDTITVKPVNRTKEYTDRFAEPITMTTPQGDNPEAGNNGTASLTTMGETLNPQTQAGSTDEGWQSQRNPKRKWGFNNEGPTAVATSQGDISTVDQDYSPIFGVQVGADTYALRTELGTGRTPPEKYKKPRSGTRKNPKPSGSYTGRR
jgi:hypothetical protein